MTARPAGASALPDGRAYELVSPPAKNGADVQARSTRTRAAADGGAVSFTSLGGFGDVHGAGIATEYLAQRDGMPGTHGWSAHGITPPQDPLTFLGALSSQEPLYVGDMSDDLTKAVFRGWSPLTSAPDVSQPENFYVREDLRMPGPGRYRLVTDCPACSSPLPAGLGRPALAGTSADFSHVLFESPLRLTIDAPPCADPNPYNCPTTLYEWVDGSVRLAGILPDGSAAGTSYAGLGATNLLLTLRTISADGSRVVFTVPGSADPSGTDQLYLRDDHGTTSTADDTTVRVSASERSPSDPGGTQSAKYMTASADGSRVFFTTSEQLTADDTNGAADLYMYDVNAPPGAHLTRLSVDHEPGDAPNSVFGVIGASTDGTYVYFIASGQLVAGKPLIGGRGVYLWHEGEGVSYVGELTDLGRDVNNDDQQAIWNLQLPESRVTPDGRHIVFGSHSGVGLTGYDHQSTGCGANGDSPCRELYVYSADNHKLVCASCNPNGSPATADATINADTGTGGSVPSNHLSRALSDDGSRLLFSSGEALVPEDTNGKSDVYEYDVSHGTIHLISSGKSPSDSYFLDASASGNDVFFATREQLVGWDVDQNYDLYDARVGGGFPDPAPVPTPCSGDGCQGQVSVAPSAPLAGTLTFGGAGNVHTVAKKAKPKPRAVKCKRGFVRKRVRGKVRCVKRPRAKRAAKASHRSRAGRTR